jgi:hypothetical protein
LDQKDRVGKQDSILDLVLYGLRMPRVPAFVHFEAEGNASPGYLYIDDFGRSFPPNSGYSFSTWLCFDVIVPRADVDILTIINSEDVVRMHFYCDTKALKLRLKTLKSKTLFTNFSPYHIVPNFSYYVQLLSNASLVNKGKDASREVSIILS